MMAGRTQLLHDFIQCRYKALLTQRGEPKQTTEYHRLSNRQRQTYHERALDDLIAKHDSAQTLVAPSSLSRSIRSQHRLILKATCSLADHRIELPPIEIGPSEGCSPRSLTPICFANANRVSQSDKLVACVFSLLVAEQVPYAVERARVIHSDSFRSRHVALRGKNGATKLGTEAQHVLDQFQKFLGAESPPPSLQLNRHCEICEFRQRCRDEAQQRDDISLLSGLSPVEISQWKDKGVLTTGQLAHTFQPKRYCRPTYAPKQHSQPLQALAAQKQTVFIRKPPMLPRATHQVFLDVEANSDDGNFYLIGMIHENGDEHVVNQLWADSKYDEGEIWHAFLKEIESLHDEFVIFHYGTYERKFIETMMERHGTSHIDRIERLQNSMCDVHQAIRTNVFFPAYSNRLKDIAGSLGCRWAGPIAVGIESIVWRKAWQSSGNGRFKDELLRYNHEDCENLRTVVRFLESLSADTCQRQFTVEPLSGLDTPTEQYGKSIAIPELPDITKRAYFNYQHERIFVRTSPSVRHSVKRNRRRSEPRVNKETFCDPPETCPRCGHDDFTLRTSDGYSKCIKDLRFSKNGVKRWVTKYISHRFVCRKCGKDSCSPSYPKKGCTCGYGLASWIVHQHVANRQPHLALVDSLNDLFGLDVGHYAVETSKQEFACKYADTERLLLDRLRQGNVICADETKIRVKGGTGYVWAFSSVEEVVYRFTDSRDGTILEEILDGFNGVVVSDFFGGYDSVSREQQKCLVHLIRDINDDLLKSPFNEELKSLARQFTALLKSIVDDIDRYGLKKRHLNKFVKPSTQFVAWVLKQEFRTKPAQRYQKRFRKYGDRLFTFLRHDGVPWNNNIAENAIKLVVSRRRFFGASYSKEGMRDYLRFLSFYQTLRRKNGGSLLRFLLSKEMDLLKYVGE